MLVTFGVSVVVKGLLSGSKPPKTGSSVSALCRSERPIVIDGVLPGERQLVTH